MGLGSLGSLNVLLSADTTQFTSAMEKAAYQAERDLQRISRSAQLNSTLIYSSLIAAATGFAASMKHTLDVADEMGKTAQMMGITTEQLSKLKYAAELSGLSVEELSASFSKMNKNAFNGAAVFTNLGVAVRDSNGNLRNGSDILLDVADKFSKMSDGVGKAAAAQEIFGKSGASMIPLLNQGKDGLKLLGDEAQNLGIVIETKLAKRAEILNDRLLTIAKTIEGMKISVLSSTLDAIVGQAEVTGNKAAYDALMAMGKYDEAAKALNGTFQKAAEASAVSAKAVTDQADALAGYNKNIEDGVKLTESLRTAQEKYNDDMEYYNTLLQGTAISQETYERAAHKATETLYRQDEASKQLNSAARDLGFTFSSAFEDAIIEGKKFNDVLVGLAKDIERITLRKMMTEPMAKALSSGISSMFSGGTGGLTGGTFTDSVITASKHGNAFQAFANGGVINGPMTFPMTGGKRGLAGEAGKEAILPLTRTSGGDLGVKSIGGGNVQVNVYAPEGSSVRQERSSSGGNDQINIIIDEAVSGAVGNPGSKTHRALKNSFGLKQALTAR